MKIHMFSSIKEIIFLSLNPSFLLFIVENLVSQVGLREDAAIVDVARATGTTETLSEMKIMCSSEEKVRHYSP